MLEKLILRHGRRTRWLVFERPRAVLSTHRPDEVPDILAEVQQTVDRHGLFAAGYLGYEAAPAFDPALTVRQGHRLPVACFGIFAEPASLDVLPYPVPGRHAAAEWILQTDRARYVERIAAIKRRIECGDCYQVNYTIRQQAQGAVDPWRLFLAAATDTPHAAYVECGDHAIVSASPELFFSLSNSKIVCRPMKGTARRGMTAIEDQAARQALAGSAKDRAENVMIADLVRNDVGKIAAAGSVRADSLFDIEKYPTVWQMTSTVTATTRAKLPEIMAAMFPSASVTGAPKASSMAIIGQLEDSPREIYTGSIGFLGPGRRAHFNVAIRTAWMDRRSGLCTYGTGGGIVWDSDPDAEFEECRIKTKVLRSAAGDSRFRLLETMLWTTEDGYFLLDQHLDRMQESAGYFDYRLDRDRIRECLDGLASKLSGARYRVRLMVERDGSVLLERARLPSPAGTAAQRLRLAAAPIDASDPFLYHKTTRRDVYEQALRAVPDCDDVLLYNADGFVTETTVANVLVELDGTWYTPPVSCGLLAGIGRQRLLLQQAVQERRIHVDDLESKTNVALVNSVRGRYSATLTAVPSASPRVSSRPPGPDRQREMPLP